MNQLRIYTIIVLTVLLAIPNLFAQQNTSQTIAGGANIQYKEGNFSIDKPFNIVYDLSNHYEEILSMRIAMFLTEKGGVPTQSNVASTRNIIIHQADKSFDTQHKDEYSILVYKDYIDIKFTTAKSMRWAFAKFKELYGEKKSIFSSKKKGFIAYTKISATTGHDVGAITLDLTTTPMTLFELTTKVAEAVERNVSTIYITLVSPEAWLIESKTFELINPKEDITQGKGYSLTDLKVLYDYSQNQGIEIVPVIDLSSKGNQTFKRFTGHRIHSVEGLRFTRAFTQEFCQSVVFDRVCFGEKIDNKSQDRYIMPLVDIARDNSVEAIILKTEK